MSKSSLAVLFSKSLGRALIVGSRLSELLGAHEWQVDFEKGRIDFGKVSYPFQFVGTESDTGTWKWGWDNVNGFDEGLLKLANEVKAYGEEKGLSLLSQSDLEVDEDCNGLSFACMATFISKVPYAYYLCEHEHGTAVLALEGLPDELFLPLGETEIPSFLLEALQTYEVAHRAFCEGVLDFLKMPYENQGSVLIAKLENSTMSLLFDDSGRLNELDLASK